MPKEKNKTISVRFVQLVPAVIIHEKIYYCKIVIYETFESIQNLR